MSPDEVAQAPEDARSLDRSLLRGLVGFEVLLYVAVAILLGTAAVLVLVGTVLELGHAISTSGGAVDTGVTVLDRILLLLIIAELAYTLRFVLRTHRIAVEPFLFIGLTAVVRGILIVTQSQGRYWAFREQPWAPTPTATA